MGKIQVNPLDEPSPLGLRLRKSPSLLDLIQMRLNYSSNNGLQTKEQKSVVAASASSAATDELKASNFPATILRIGTWEGSSRFAYNDDVHMELLDLGDKGMKKLHHHLMHLRLYQNRTHRDMLLQHNCLIAANFHRIKISFLVLPNVGHGEGSENSEDQGSRSSSDAKLKYEIGSMNGELGVGDNDQPRNERVGPGKKARGFRMESSANTANVGSDSGSTGFVFVQGATTHTVASKGGESGIFAKYDEEEYSDDVNYDDDKIVNEEAPIGIVKSDADDDVSQEDNSGKDEDVLLESIKGLDSAQDEFAREVQKWKDVGKDEPSIFDDPILNMLERKDAKILKFESTLTSADTEAEFEDHLKKRIQVEVEYIVISTKTETLTSELLRDITYNYDTKD